MSAPTGSGTHAPVVSYPDRHYLLKPDGSSVKDYKGLPVHAPSKASVAVSVLFTIGEGAAQSAAGFASYPIIRAKCAASTVALIEAATQQTFSDEDKNILLGFFEGLADPLASVVANALHGFVGICTASLRVGVNRVVEYATTPRGQVEPREREAKVTRHFILVPASPMYRITMDQVLPASFGIASFSRGMLTPQASPETKSRTSPAEGTYAPSEWNTSAVVNCLVGVAATTASLVAARAKDGQLQWAPPPELTLASQAKGYANRLNAGVKMAISSVRLPVIGGRIPLPVMTLQSIIGVAGAKLTSVAGDSQVAKGFALLANSMANGLTHWERVRHWLETRNSIETPPAKWQELIAHAPESLKQGYIDAQKASDEAIKAQYTPARWMEAVATALLPSVITMFGGTAAMTLGQTPWAATVSNYEGMDMTEPFAELAIGATLGLTMQIAASFGIPDPIARPQGATPETPHTSRLHQLASGCTGGLASVAMAGFVGKAAGGNSSALVTTLGATLASLNPSSVTGFIRTLCKAVAQTEKQALGQTAGTLTSSGGQHFLNRDGYWSTADSKDRNMFDDVHPSLLPPPTIAEDPVPMDAATAPNGTSARFHGIDGKFGGDPKGKPGIREDGSRRFIVPSDRATLTKLAAATGLTPMVHESGVHFVDIPKDRLGQIEFPDENGGYPDMKHGRGERKAFSGPPEAESAFGIDMPPHAPSRARQSPSALVHATPARSLPKISAAVQSQAPLSERDFRPSGGTEPAAAPLLGRDSTTIHSTPAKRTDLKASSTEAAPRRSPFPHGTTPQKSDSATTSPVKFPKTPSKTRKQVATLSQLTSALEAAKREGGHFKGLEVVINSVPVRVMKLDDSTLTVVVDEGREAAWQQAKPGAIKTGSDTWTFGLGTTDAVIMRLG